MNVGCKIAIVGEAWGQEEEAQRTPFVGASGWHLNQMLEEAGIHRADCFLTNCFNLRPPGGNDVGNLCVAKSDSMAVTYLPPVAPAKYLHKQYLPELERLRSELSDVRPNISIALGNTAAWALLSNTGISRIRGTVTQGPFIEGLKILPTFHPAAVLRDWSLRPVTVLDLAKAKRESEFPEIRRPERTVYIEPTLDDLEWYFETHLRNARLISFDIETSGDQITCIGFAPGPSSAIVIPFRDIRQRDPGGRMGCYWSTHEAEVVAWRFVRRVLSLPQPKVAQNGLYDINYLWTRYGITVVNYEDDTMLLHHALQPESLKGLGFLGSVYTNESSWKMMNRRDPTIKREK